MSEKGISSSAFIDLSTITSVNFGNKCTFVGEDAFKNCISLEEINEKNFIKEIYGGAFAGTKLSSVKFNNLESIKTFVGNFGAFESCSNLRSVDVGNCTEIPSRTFKACSNLSHVNAIKCKSVGTDAFRNCTNLSDINIPECAYIGDSAFYKCTNLIKFNGINTNIGKEAFLNCSSLKYIDFKNCTYIGINAFRDCSSLENANLDKCGKIETNAFINCKNLKQITLSSCFGIGNCAFLNCIGLDKVYINTKPNQNCIPLGESVFYNYESELLNGIYSINSNIRFYLRQDIIEKYKTDDNWSEYKDYMIQLPENNQIIYTTNNNEKIDTNNISIDGISISNEYNTNYGIIEFTDSSTKEPKNIENLNKEIFNNKKTLVSVELPLTCTKIDESAFEGCESLNSFTQSSLNVLTNIEKYAFKNCTAFTSFTIPESVKELGEGIFAGCSKKEKIDGNFVRYNGIEKFDGNFVRYNGKAIVYNNTLICVLPKDDNDTKGRIYDISEIDPTITKLGEYCFSGCEELIRLDIPSNVKSIGKYAFEGCENLREIHLNRSSVPNFIEPLFGKSDDGTTENIPENLKIFVPEDYYDTYIKVLKRKYKKLSNYIYPKPKDNCITYYDNKYNTIEIENLPTNYFYNNSNVTKIILGENITEISKEAFKNCTNLDYIYLPNTISKFGDECFSGCKKLTSITIPNRYLKEKTIFGNKIFYGCENLEKFISYYSDFINEDGRCYIDNDTLKFFAYGGITPLKKYIMPENITKINKYVFSDVFRYNGDGDINTAIKYKIKLPDSITSIGDSAFEGCNIMKLNIPTNVKNIGNNAFKNCSNCIFDNINNIVNGGFTIPDSITSIGDSCFENSSIEKLYISENNKLTKIPTNAFKDCKYLTEVVIDGGVTDIGNGAFEGCEKLTEVHISKSTLKTIGSNTFKDCIKCNFENNKINKYGENVVVFTIPDNVTSIGDSCFENSGIKKLHISEKNELTKIPTNAFKDCKELTEIHISKSKELKTIGSNAFKNCEKLEINDKTDLVYTDNNDSVIKYNTEMTLPDSITSIGDSAFEGCKISSIILPSNLLQLGDLCLSSKENLNINIPLSLSKPPYFTKGGFGKVNIDALPFGDPVPESFDESESIENDVNIINDTNIENNMNIGNNTNIENNTNNDYTIEGDKLNIIIPYSIVNNYKKDDFWKKYIDYITITYLGVNNYDTIIGGGSINNSIM